MALTNYQVQKIKDFYASDEKTDTSTGEADKLYQNYLSGYKGTDLPSISKGYAGTKRTEGAATLSDFLEGVADKSAKATEADATSASNMIKDANKQQYKDYDKYLGDINKFKDEYTGNVESQRATAKGIVKEQAEDIGRNAQIQSAKAGMSGKYTEKEIARVQRDVLNSYSSALSESKSNLNDFESSLDEKLNTFNMTVADKQQLVSQLKGQLKDEEIEPFIDAIATNATNRQSFDAMFSEFYAGLLEGDIDFLTQRSEEEYRYAFDINNFNESTPEENKTTLARKVGYVLSPTEAKKFIESIDFETVSDYEVAKIFAYIDRARQLNEIQQDSFIQALATSTDASEAFYQTTIDRFDNFDFTGEAIGDPLGDDDKNIDTNTDTVVTTDTEVGQTDADKKEANVSDAQAQLNEDSRIVYDIRNGYFYKNQNEGYVEEQLEQFENKYGAIKTSNPSLYFSEKRKLFEIFVDTGVFYTEEGKSGWRNDEPVTDAE